MQEKRALSYSNFNLNWYYRSLNSFKAKGESEVKKNMLFLFERFHGCDVNAFYGMSKFCSVQMLSPLQCIDPLTFLYKS